MFYTDIYAEILQWILSPEDLKILNLVSKTFHRLLEDKLKDLAAFYAYDLFK